MSEGPTIAESVFKSTSSIQNLPLSFFEEFERQKMDYGKNKKKNLR